jgi:hypothetical protein
MRPVMAHYGPSHCPITTAHHTTLSAQVHGSGGNVTAGQRRLAASVRYVGDDVRWRNKATATTGAPARLHGDWRVSS